jgi:hypothetical protein
MILFPIFYIDRFKKESENVPEEFFLSSFERELLKELSETDFIFSDICLRRWLN